jgi:hypothetical protein
LLHTARRLHSHPCKGVVKRIGLTGGCAVVLATGQDNPTAIAVAGDSVFWLNAGKDADDDGTVMKWTPD